MKYRMIERCRDAFSRLPSISLAHFCASPFKLKVFDTIGKPRLRITTRYLPERLSL